MFNKKRTVIFSGVKEARTVYDIMCVIRMVTDRDKLDYLRTGDETEVTMLGYKASDADQKVIADILKKTYPTIGFMYLNKN